MQEFINWGGETPEQLAERRKFEEEMREFAINKMIAEARQAANQASAAFGGGKVANEDPLAGSGSITFNGTDQYVSSPNAQVATWLPGTGDFTIEWFMKKGVGGGGGAPRVFSLGYDTGATIGCSVESTDQCYIWPYGSDLVGTLPAGYVDGTAWTHVAISRSGTVTKLFINGVLAKTKTGDSRSLTNVQGQPNSAYGYNLNMGVDNPSATHPNWWAGKITNFRWVNAAVYTATFSVPTSPLTAIANTKLLMLGGTQADPVRDSAGLNTLTNHGGVWNTDTPF